MSLARTRIQRTSIEGIYGYIFGIRLHGEWTLCIGRGVGTGATIGEAMQAALIDLCRAA